MPRQKSISYVILLFPLITIISVGIGLTVILIKGKVNTSKDHPHCSLEQNSKSLTRMTLCL